MQVFPLLNYRDEINKHPVLEAHALFVLHKALGKAEDALERAAQKAGKKGKGKGACRHEGKCRGMALVNAVVS